MRIKANRLNTLGRTMGPEITEILLTGSLPACLERAAAELGDGWGLNEVQQTIVLPPDWGNEIAYLYEIRSKEEPTWRGLVTNIEIKIGNKTKLTTTMLRK